MSLLPKSQKEFSDPVYWKKFFDKHDTPFEWYGDYSQLSCILDKYIKLSDTILQIGCGNSQLSEQLYDNGFRNVTSIDTDPRVIKSHKTNNARKRPELVFECRSAADTGLTDESVNVVLDKGTTDALLPLDASPAQRALVADVFAEVERCLRPLGRFVVVTLAQAHIVHTLLEHFHARRRALIRVQKCELADKDFVMPVFVFVITKLKTPLPIVPNMEFVRELCASQIDRVADYEHLMRLIEAEQELNWLRHYVTKNVVDDVSIQICDQSGKNRYVLTIVDNAERAILRSMAAFIVPLGREADWIFSTSKGRRILRKECGRDRVIVVGLYRDQNYESLNQIKSELGRVVLDLKPKGFDHEKIDFLSLGSVDVTHSIASGKSAINGEWSVEHVKRDKKTFRRLIFLSSAGLVQSEAEIIKGKRRKQFKIRSDLLTCDHHRSMLTAINFACLETPKNNFLNGAEILTARERALKMAVLGLGGGLFPRFLYENFPKAIITSVEFDADVLTIAQKYFGLPPLSVRFRVLIEDAQKFLDNTSSNKNDDEKYTLIFVDLAGPVQTDGLSCPPAKFVSHEALAKMKMCLEQRGVLAFNLVTRDEEKSEEVKCRIRKVFSQIYTINSKEDVNEVLICPMEQEPISIRPVSIENDKAEWLNNHFQELSKLSILK